jgi:hypothetical protein
MESKSELIKRIIAFEWDMFQAVNEGGPRASCQNDPETFEGMRRGQFEAWSEAACASYFDDLAGAVLDGRNLVTEKYIHMMKNSEPGRYEKLTELIPMPGGDVRALAREISDKLLEQTVALFEAYPHVSGAGRPLRSASDLSGVTSIETYQLGELYTYSAKTLEALRAHLLALEAEGRSLAQEILENSVRHYGYTSLDEAETSARRRAEAAGVEVTFNNDGRTTTKVQL